MKLFAFALLLALDVGPHCGSTTKNDCTKAGGACVGISDCAVGEGFSTDKTCNSASLQCCLPTCGSAVEDYYCCNGSFSTRPVCTAGKLDCPSGHHVCGSLHD